MGADYHSHNRQAHPRFQLKANGLRSSKTPRDGVTVVIEPLGLIVMLSEKDS